MDVNLRLQNLKFGSFSPKIHCVHARSQKKEELSGVVERAEVPLSLKQGMASRHLMETNEIEVNESEIEDTDRSYEFEDDSDDDDYVPKILSKKVENPDCIECDKCHKRYKNTATLKQHHLKSCNAQSKTSKNTPRVHKCPHCETTFDKCCDLKSHLKSSHNGFPCKVCGKVLKQKRSLVDHELTHSEPTLICTMNNCNKGFYTRKAFTYHQKTVHAVNRQYVCEVCGYQTYCKSALGIHVRGHTGEKPYKCDICGKSFSSSSSLSIHKPTHSTEKPHVCDVCGKAFSLRKSLYHHKFLHSNVKQFVCKICGNAFAQMAALSAHSKKHKMDNYL